jgi:glycosyltransferase involved in cell wall biosynthesis
VLRESGVPDTALRILPNTVSDVIARSALGSDVVFLGRLEAAKGVDLLLRAWEGAAVSGRQLHLYGDGPLRALAEQAAGVVCHGVVSKEEVARALESAALVVVPSVWDEPFGRTVIEAYAHGRPVIATRTGALPELVDHHTGWLVPPETAALRSALELALGDARELERRGQAARLRYERDYAPDAYVRRFVALYQATAHQM